MSPTNPVVALLEVMERLRDPRRGCPWDRAQRFATIVPHTIEEAYEVADAIDRGDFAALEDELGDLLFQVVFHAQMAREQGLFDFADVARGLQDKLVRRHPHVFGQARLDSDAERQRFWEEEKARERSAKGPGGTLDGVAHALPALSRARKLQQRAARVGFDWADIAPVVDKVQEELDEVRAEVRAGTDPRRLAEELGDLLFTVVNLTRHAGVDPEETLRQGNRKFESRFRAVEARLEQQGKRPDECTPEELDALWEQVK